MSIIKHTEAPSRHRHLEQQDTNSLLYGMNEEDQLVPQITKQAIPQIVPLVDAIVDHLLSGGRLFYLGAGTSGRLGIVDASECPPTFGVDHGLVVGLMAGGDGAIRKAVEFAEDDPKQGWKDLQQYGFNHKDVLVGIAASGTTPYVVGAVREATAQGMITGCITCNEHTPLAAAAKFPIEVITGPEFVTGSTRLKAGTAQKLTLNMITTTTMIKLGRVEDNRMIDMQLSNDKLVERGTKMVMAATKLDFDSAQRLLLREGSVRKSIEKYQMEKK